MKGIVPCVMITTLAPSSNAVRLATAIRFQWTGRMSSENMLEARSTDIGHAGQLRDTCGSSSGSIDGRTAPDR